MKICTHCGKEIERGENYFSFADNFLLAKYFDSEEDNIFCSEECACANLILTEIENEDDEEEEDEEKEFDPKAVEVRLLESPLVFDYNKPCGFEIEDNHYTFHTWSGALATYCEYLSARYGAEAVKDAILLEKERRKDRHDFWGFPFYDKQTSDLGENAYKLRDTELYIRWDQTEVGIEKTMNALGNLFPDTRLHLVE